MHVCCHPFSYGHQITAFGVYLRAPAAVGHTGRRVTNTLELGHSSPLTDIAAVDILSALTGIIMISGIGWWCRYDRVVRIQPMNSIFNSRLRPAVRLAARSRSPPVSGRSVRQIPTSVDVFTPVPWCMYGVYGVAVSTSEVK